MEPRDVSTAGRPSVGAEQASSTIEVSVVMPCLNEAETVGICVEKARQGLDRLAVSGEVILADNGSTDGSQAIAERGGARVVPVPTRGYGNALRAGLLAARGKYIIMADSDDSYDFSELRPFLSKLNEGYDLVIGNRFSGKIEPGAMPWKHRWLGNPGLTAVGRILFGSPIGDFISGMRGMRKAAFDQIEFRCPGMEFCVELIARCSLMGMKMADVPIVLKKDGRSRAPHMRSWRDGWRILRFMLLLSPFWLFILPGILCVLGGLAAGTLSRGSLPASPDPGVASGSFLMSFVPILAGFHLMLAGVFAKLFAIRERLHPPSRFLERYLRVVTSGFTALTGAVVMLVGISLPALSGPLALVLPKGFLSGFALSVMLVVIGMELILVSFFFGLMRLHRNSEWY